MEQAAVDKIAPWCSDYPMLFTSPSDRAKHMADAIATTYGLLTPVSDNRLAEMHFGIFDGLTAAECEARYPNAWKAWMADFMHYKIPHGESNDDVQSRVAAMLADLAAESYETVIIVTHGGVIRAMLAQLLDLPPEAGWHFDIALAGIIRINVIQNYGILKAFNI